VKRHNFQVSCFPRKCISASWLWSRGITLVLGQHAFTVLRSACSWWVITYAGKPSATGQPTRPTQPFEVHKSVVSSNRVAAISVEVVPPDECLRGEGLVWLIGAVVCLLAATVGPMSVSTGSGGPHLRCSTTGSCQSTATSEIVKVCCSWSTM